jgi:hypothetical protein
MRGATYRRILEGDLGRNPEATMSVTGKPTYRIGQPAQSQEAGPDR